MMRRPGSCGFPAGLPLGGKKEGNMQYREFGPESAETLLLLHGGGLSWWNYREEAELLRRDYHVLLPVLDGHAGSDRHFTSIGDSASELLSLIDERFGGRVLLIGGLSLGGQILLEMLCRRGDVCRCALVESAMVLPSRLTHALIGLAFGASWGLTKNRRFAKLQFASLRMKEDLFEDYYRDTRAIEKKDMIAFMKANTAYALGDAIAGCEAAVHVVAGEKETRGILRSAELIRQRVPGSSLTILPGLYHGEFSINHADRYVRAVRSILAGGKP